MTWQEWQTIVPMECLAPGHVEINKAEFLAALLTSETFARYCANKITVLALDNRVAKNWFDTARCPIFPFDRCAQGVHLYMIQQSMKVQTTWIASAENKLADIFSWRKYEKRRDTHMVLGKRLQKVRPRWANALKFIS